MKRVYAETPKGQIHYVTEGSGDPLLLLHVCPLSWSMYRSLIPLLSRARHVIAMDLIGFGNSDPAPSSYKQMADYADNVVHLLDALGIKKADILASIDGSIVAVEAAIKYPERVGRLVLLGFPICLTPEERRARVEGAEDPKTQFGYEHDKDGSYLVKIVKMGATGNLREVVGGKAAQGYPVNFQFVDDWVIGAIKLGAGRGDWAAKVYSHDNQARLPLVKASTLVIGLGGPNVGPSVRGEERARAVQSLIPRSKLVMVNGPGADLQVTYDRADELAGIILPFLGSSAS